MGPMGPRVVDCPWTRLRREGSEGSKGGGLPLRDNEYKYRLTAVPPT